MVFIAYKLRAETLKGWLLDDPGKECRSHCQSPVGRDEVIQTQDAVIWSKGRRKPMTDVVEILSKRRHLGNGHRKPNEQKKCQIYLLNNNFNSYPVLNTLVQKPF